MKNIVSFLMKIFIFDNLKNGHVFVMLGLAIINWLMNTTKYIEDLT